MAVVWGLALTGSGAGEAQGLHQPDGLKPDDAKAHFGLGQALAGKGQPRMAIFSVVALVLPAFIAVGHLFAEVQGDAKAGKEKYLTLCAGCHGTSGKGDGPGAERLSPKPRDHTNGEYMNTLTDQYLFDVVKKGGRAAGLSELMPGWGRALSDKEIQDLVAYVRALAVPPYKPPKK